MPKIINVQDTLAEIVLENDKKVLSPFLPETSNVQFFTYLIKNYLRNSLAFRCSYINFNNLLNLQQNQGRVCVDNDG